MIFVWKKMALSWCEEQEMNCMAVTDCLTVIEVILLYHLNVWLQCLFHAVFWSTPSWCGKPSMNRSASLGGVYPLCLGSGSGSGLSFLDRTFHRRSSDNGLLVEVLLYIHRNRRFIRDGSAGCPPRLSHSSWTLTLKLSNNTVFIYAHQLTVWPDLIRLDLTWPDSVPRSTYLQAFWPGCLAVTAPGRRGQRD